MRGGKSITFAGNSNVPTVTGGYSGAMFTNVWKTITPTNLGGLEFLGSIDNGTSYQPIALQLNVPTDISKYQYIELRGLLYQRQTWVVTLE